MLEANDAVLVVIDVQERLLPAMGDRGLLVDSLQRLIKGMSVLEVPVILTEQYPKGLGHTVPEIAALLPGIAPLPKLSFDCCADAGFKRELERLGRKQAVVCGIECHICVYQTTCSLLALGYQVTVASDCVSSRSAANRAVGLRLMERRGADVSSTETVLFEMLKVAEGDRFKRISQIVK